MDRQSVSSRLNFINDDIIRLMNDLYAIEITNTAIHPINYEELTTMAALRAEKIACSLRHLIYTTTEMKKAVFMGMVAKVHGFKIETAPESVTISIPSLLPKRKGKSSSGEFLIDPLFQFLSEYTKENEVKKFDDCVICLEHIYDEKLSHNRVRDYDNIEIKKIQDVIATFFLLDDSGKYCDSYNTTSYGSCDCTRIVVMERAAFPEWFAAHRGQPQQGKKQVGKEEENLISASYRVNE